MKFKFSLEEELGKCHATIRQVRGSCKPHEKIQKPCPKAINKTTIFPSHSSLEKLTCLNHAGLKTPEYLKLDLQRFLSNVKTFYQSSLNTDSWEWPINHSIELLLMQYTMSLTKQLHSKSATFSSAVTRQQELVSISIVQQISWKMHCWIRMRNRS